MKQIKYFPGLCLVVLAGLLTGCKKFLQEKPDQKLVVPETITDLQSILDIVRTHQFDPASGERSSDNFYVTSANWESLRSEEDKRAYIWAGEYIFEQGVNNEWAYTYQNIFRSNIVLNAMENIEIRDTERQEANAVAGMASFIRGRSLFNALLLWAPAYDATTAAQDLGVSLRTDPDISIPTTRASNKQCYDQVLADVRNATVLLPDVSIHPVRPSKAAACGLMARVFLSMRKYDSAFVYADRSLRLKSDLLNFNDIPNPAATYPMQRFNEEVLYDAKMVAPSLLNTPRAKTDSLLYRSYEENDLRKAIYFVDNRDGTFGFKANYSGNNTGFGGIATDEIYLIRAECLARLQETDLAMQDLNTLLETRWKTGTFVPFTASDAGEALSVILRERRKELLMRGLRWMDIKRLNREGYNITPKRVINGVEYILLPNERRYALPIPEDIVANTGIQQN